jgi:spore coat protein CotF
MTMRGSMGVRPLAMRSALANRKMFRGGGMVPMGNSMANMQPMGILASSQPLVDAVAGDILNPQGGATLSMADGGIAKFHVGGAVHDHPHNIESYEVPSLTFGGYEQDPSALNWPVPVRSDFADASIGQLQTESPSSRVNRMFPMAAGPGGRTHGDRRPEDSVIPGRVGRWLSEFGSGVESMLEGGLEGLLIDAGTLIDAAFSDEMDPESERFIPNFGMGERTTLAHLVARAPEGLKEDIMEIGKSLISQKDYDISSFGHYAESGSGGLASNPLAQDIAEVLHNKYEQPEIDRVYQTVLEQERMQEGQVTRYPVPTTTAEELQIGDAPADSLSAMRMRPEHLEMLRNAADPTEVAEVIRGLQESGLPLAYTDELIRVFQAEGEDLRAAEEGLVASSEARDEEIRASLLEARDEEIRASLLEARAGRSGHPLIAGVATVPAPATDTKGVATVRKEPPRIREVLPSPDELRYGQLVNELHGNITPLGTDFAEANTPETREAARKTLEQHIQDFAEAVPDYEGKSEWEKGMDIVKMGMAIAAGQSPNAIENISKGVMATIDNFTSDEEERRAYERQIKLSAAKYGLDAMNADLAREEADKRKLFFFYDQATVSPDNPYGDTVVMSLADILETGGIPKSYKDRELVLAERSAMDTAIADAKDMLLKNAKLYRIDSDEANAMKETLDEINDSFVSGSVGIALLNTALGRVAAGNVTGYGNAGKELIRRAMVGIGYEPGHKFKDIEFARAEVRRAFQLLIPESLGQAQTANSISNRDVQFLADAYIDSGFLANGVFDFVDVSEEALGKRLIGAMDVFREAQVDALRRYDGVLQRITESEKRLSEAQKGGIPASPGPFGQAHFEPYLERIGPLAEGVRSAGEEAPTGLWSYAWDEDKEKFRYKGAEGSVFEGEFFDPTEENFDLLYGRGS